MTRLAFIPLLLLAAAAPPPEPERPKLPAVPEREKELLRSVQALPELLISHQLTTAICHVRQQAREIAGYLLAHDAEKGRELHLHRLALLDAAALMRDDLRELKRAAAPATSPPLAPPVYDVDPASAKECAKWVAAHRRDLAAQATHTIQRPPEPTPAPPRAQPGHIRAPKPSPPSVRCPVRHCRAGPGKSCRGHSGEAMDSIHPERERAARRAK